MTVAELIELLSYEDPNADVSIYNYSDDAYATYLDVLNVDGNGEVVFIEAN